MRRALALVTLLLFLAVPSVARADVAPPGQPSGSNLGPGTEVTQVRMAAETVLIDVQPGTSDQGLGFARVTADFTMHNTGAVGEHMAVRFPIAADDGWGQVKEISDLRVHVEGQLVATRRVTGPDPSIWSSRQVPWAEFDVAFPSQQDLDIQVQYTLQGGGEFPFSRLTYILATGAGWKDTIGSADMIVQLPYEANIENVLLSSPGIFTGTTLGGSLEGNRVLWHFSNLEPTAQDNFEVNLVAPQAWKQLLAEQSNVAQHPTDGESWGRIGKLCKQMAFSPRGKGFRVGLIDSGGIELYERSLDAYERAVALLPKDALWHAGYAEALAYHAYFEDFSGVDPMREALQAMREISAALQLAPNDPTVAEIAQEISFFFPDGMWPHAPVSQQTGFVIAWLTTTPTPVVATPSTVPTELSENTGTGTAEPTDTAAVAQVPPTVEPTPVPSSSKPSVPLCGSALLLPLGLVVWAFVRPRMNTH